MDSETRALAARIARLETEISMLKSSKIHESPVEPSGDFHDGSMWYDNGT